MNQEELDLLHVLVKVFDSLDAHKTPCWLSRFFNACAKVLKREFRYLAFA